MGFHMMNLLRRLVDVFRMDAIAMNVLTAMFKHPVRRDAMHRVSTTQF
ncbi:MAG: hypothetical protein LBL24_06970 [Bacteroidales bacterium]|nr:hypothetical protein [Bacteroidales bacterium]